MKITKQKYGSYTVFDESWGTTFTEFEKSGRHVHLWRGEVFINTCFDAPGFYKAWREMICNDES